MKKYFGNLLYKLSDKLAHKIPAPLLGFFSMPLNYQMNSRDASIYESTRMINLAFAFCMNNKIKGDFVEFGVYEGKTSREAYRAAKLCGADKIRLYAFDSFEGLPKIGEKDKGEIFQKGEFACSRAEYENNLKTFGANLEKFEIVEGYYDKTLPNYNGANEIAIAWIDCDLYESTVPVLNFLTNRLTNGAILIFDDWFCFQGAADKGEQLACREWLEQNPTIKLIEYQKFHWAGMSFIVNRPNKF